MTRRASCACGNLTAICEGEPRGVSICHCLECQRRTGSIFGVAASYSPADVRIEGNARTFTRGSDDGTSVTFHFCPDCGSTVFWHLEAMPGIVAVAVGAFADPTFPAPTRSVYGERRHSWAEITGPIARSGGAS
jgi:hypothetical protein